MTRVTFTYTSRALKAEIDGHADRVNGSREICGKVSVLAQMLMECVREYVGDGREAVIVSESGYVLVDVDTEKLEPHMVRDLLLLFDMARTGFQIVSAQFPNAVICVWSMI